MMYRNTPLTEREKAHRRRVLGLKRPFSEDKPTPELKKVREFTSVTREDYIPAKPRGRSGCRLRADIRAMVRSKAARRAAFIDAISRGL